MTLISALVNKFLVSVGAADVAATESSSVTFFVFFAITMIVSGILTIVKKRPVIGKYESYTPASVARAALPLGIGEIVLGILDIIIGVIRLDRLPVVLIGAAAAAALAAFIVIETLGNKKLVKA